MKIEDSALLAYFRQKPACERCGRRQEGGLQPHHILARGHGGGLQMDTPLNLLALCGTIPGFYNGCHDEVHSAGAGGRRECLDIVARREGLPSGQVVLEALWELQRRRKP
jgi:hypothetical protein